MFSRERVGVLTIVLLYTTAVFVADRLTPREVDVWVLYMPVILVPVWFNSIRMTVVTAVVCSALILVDLFMFRTVNRPVLAAVNLGTGVLAMWIMALAAITITRRSKQLTAATQTLQESIRQVEQSERALAKTEERLRLAMSGAGMGTFDRDVRTGKSIWSETHFRMLGYEPSPGGEATVEMWQCRLHPNDRERVLEAQEQSRRNNSLFGTEYRIRRADDGRVAWLAVFGRWVYDESGVAVRFLGVSFDITRRKELEREVLEIAADEQRRIGQELHDDVGQELTGLALMANALTQRMQTATPEKQISGRLGEGLDRVHRQVQSLSRGLIPVQVESKGLWAALEDLASGASQKSGIPVTFDFADSVEAPDHATATQLYRIAQEAVSNSLRHGKPQHIDLTLKSVSDGLCLSIRDDGVGMNGHPDSGHGVGLHIMQYRAEQIGATLQICNAQDGGTVVTCTLARRK